MRPPLRVSQMFLYRQKLPPPREIYAWGPESHMFLRPLKTPPLSTPRKFTVTLFAVRALYPLFAIAITMQSFSLGVAAEILR